MTGARNDDGVMDDPAAIPGRGTDTEDEIAAGDVPLPAPEDAAGRATGRATEVGVRVADAIAETCSNVTGSTADDGDRDVEALAALRGAVIVDIRVAGDCADPALIVADGADTTPESAVGDRSDGLRNALDLVSHGAPSESATGSSSGRSANQG